MMKKIFCLLLLVAFPLIFSCPVLAQDVPYEGYTYDQYKNEQIAPALYRNDKQVSFGTSEEPASLTDMYVWEGKLYVLDSAQSQVLVLDEKMQILEKKLFYDENKSRILFEQAKGLFVCEDGIYISDTTRLCVERFDWDGIRNMRYEKPQSPAYDDSISFAVTKIIVDSGKNVYALVDGLYSGAVMFSENGDFLGFYGPNEVEMTVEMLLDQSWKKLLTDEQKSAMNRFVPIAYTSFDIDEENFVYTCSRNAISESTRVRKLNPSGKGMWDGKKLLFGDYIPENQWVSGLSNVSQIIDIDIGSDGILKILDASRGRIFLYDTNGTLLGVFGGKGNQAGTFENPIALESLERYIYVLDEKSSRITRFSSTEYGDILNQALTLYNSGEYEKALPLWKQVIARDNYSKLAYTGTGKALLQQGNYKEALEHFRLGEDRESYSEAFEEYRFQYMRENFTVIATGVLLVMILLLAVRKLKKDRKEAAKKTSHWAMLKAPVTTLQDLLYKKQLSAMVATIIVVSWFGLEIVKFFGTGFIFNPNSPADFNIFLPLMSTIILYVLFVVVNWAVSTLTDGKGTLRTIYCSTSYVLLPYLLTQAAVLVLSHVFVLEEQAFLTFILLTGYVWSGILLLIVLTTVHDYTIGKACGNLFLTLFGMLILVFLLFMAIVLFEHVANLFMTIYNELTLRM